MKIILSGFRLESIFSDFVKINLQTVKGNEEFYRAHVNVIHLMIHNFTKKNSGNYFLRNTEFEIL